MLRQTFLIAILMTAATARAALPDDALVDDGSRKLQSGDVDGALAAFAEAAKKAPRDPRPHYLTGAALAQKHDAAGAEKEYRAALAIDPKLAEVRNELATLLLERGRTSEAVAELKQAVALKPDLGEGWFNLGRAAMRDKSCAAAVDAYGHAAKLMPNDADTFVDLSAAQRACKQLDGALASARQAVKLQARSPDAHLNLAFALEAAGKLDDAAAEATIATRLAPTAATPLWTLGTIELKRKKLPAAVAALDKARALKPSPAIVDDLGVAWRDQGELAKAEALFREAVTKSPRYAPARWHLAETLVAEHKCAELKSELGALPPAEARSEQAQKLRAACK